MSTDKDINVMFVIPARGGSKRLERKNIYNILGRPMMSYAINACNNSSFAKDQNVYVTSEDKEILRVAKKYGANTITRPKKLSADDVWTQKVVQHAVKNIEKKLEIKFDVIVRVQANSPQVTNFMIDKCINKLIENSLYEVFTVDENGIEDAAIHVMKRQCVDQKALSVYKGIVTTNYVDIHTIEDANQVEEILKTMNSSFITENNLTDFVQRIENDIFDIGPTRDADGKYPYYWGWLLKRGAYFERLEQVFAKSEEFAQYIKDPNTSKKSILDLGCGMCTYWPILSKFGFTDFVGIDLYELRCKDDPIRSGQMVSIRDGAKELCERYSIDSYKIITADATNLDNVLSENGINKKFDLIISCSTGYRHKQNVRKRSKTGNRPVNDGISSRDFSKAIAGILSENGINIYAG